LTAPIIADTGRLLRALASAPGRKHAWPDFANALRRVFAGAPEGSELALRAFAFFDGRALYSNPATLAQILAGDR
jgi:hypothetical protein